ncbi:MAG: glycosyltransferase [Candidatus Jordarchaeaceae archaeon]
MLRLEVIKSPEKPMVTIGVCVRNCEDTLRDAIESILSQDFPHRLIEVIFVDDGSIDQTLQIIEEYLYKMDMNVKLFHHSWKGLGFSRNIVVTNASGKYIIWVDGDMMITKDHVRKQVDFMEKNPNVGIAKAQYGLSNNQSFVAMLEDIPFIVLSLQNHLQGLKLSGTGGSIYRVSAIRQVGGFDEKLSGVGEDLDAAYRLMSANWAIRKSPAIFFEKRETSWKSLWRKYVWYGYGNFWVYCKNKRVITPYKMIPPVSLIVGLLYSFPAYKVTRKKVVFLLPIHFIFKSTAWLLGFLKGMFQKNRVKIKCSK